ncbi:formylglycine-generating enzyme family protein [Aestuariibacter sp. GS-14]|uniref:formylglycine-generating enzyme family protein n=1 Tax=Aestuariibacter sp. GS-14 TaxID=2590670 RepID=UPI00112B41FC|nr:SUMF1/EgtB/PvdO family nonheme iron enzyme [Aestuariibacter sp. GS-14]TPV53691.1 formylglycine-generating enzyme family protein [Aestuariibacter sp. GS-14]
MIRSSSHRLLIVVSIVLITGSINGKTLAEPLLPSMVKVPAGDFVLGSTEYEDTQPQKRVNVAEFYVSQYEVTRAEFARFADSTGYAVPQTCYHEIGKWWFEQESEGNWTNNAINQHELEPVSCVGYDAAVAYTEWLQVETGMPYRLLSEAEWEYLATQFASPSDSVCDAANLADQRAESVAQRQFHTSYINLIGIESCDDRAGTVSVVGQYAPDKLGIYDLIGNVNEFVSDCYVENYADMPTSGRAVYTKSCETVVLRGGAWHWPAWPVRIRDAKPRNWIGVLEGFRLALDTAEHIAVPASQGSELRNALSQYRQQRVIPPPLPDKPEGLTANVAGNDISLNWDTDKVAGHCVILANQQPGGRFDIIGFSDKPGFKDTFRAQRAYQYVVANVQNNAIGPYSLPVDIALEPLPVAPTLPATHFVAMDNALVVPCGADTECVTGPRSGSGATLLTYEFAIEKPGNYLLSAKGGGEVTFTAEIAGQTRVVSLSDGAMEYLALSKGIQRLTLITEQSGWHLDTLHLTKDN